MSRIGLAAAAGYVATIYAANWLIEQTTFDVEVAA